MKIQDLTKFAAVLLLTGVLAGCDQGADEGVETVDPGVGAAELPAEDDMPALDDDAEVEVE